MFWSSYAYVFICRRSTGYIANNCILKVHNLVKLMPEIYTAVFLKHAQIYTWNGLFQWCCQVVITIKKNTYMSVVLRTLMEPMLKNLRSRIQTGQTLMLKTRWLFLANTKYLSPTHVLSSLKYSQNVYFSMSVTWKWIRRVHYICRLSNGVSCRIAI